MRALTYYSCPNFRIADHPGVTRDGSNRNAEYGHFGGQIVIDQVDLKVLCEAFLGL
jgi:hypothetical protein